MLLASEIFTCAVSFVLPVVLAVYFCYTLRDGWKWLLYGALCYVLLGMLARLSLLTFLNSFEGFKSFSTDNLYGYTLLISLLNSLLVVGGTWLIMKVCAHRETSYKDALDYGLGLGGMASMLLVGVSSVQLIMLSNSEIPALPIFLAGLERVSVLLIQMGWSLWIMVGVKEHKPVWVLFAFLADLIPNALVTMMNEIWKLPVYCGSILLAVCGLLMGAYIVMVIKQAIEIKKEKQAARARKVAARPSASGKAAPAASKAASSGKKSGQTSSTAPSQVQSADPPAVTPAETFSAESVPSDAAVAVSAPAEPVMEAAPVEEETVILEMDEKEPIQESDDSESLSQ